MKMAEDSEDMTWNEQLRTWLRDSGKSKAQLHRESGIPSSTLSDYTSGKVVNLEMVSPERRRILYEATKLECFKYQGPRINMPRSGGPKEEGHETEVGVREPSGEEYLVIMGKVIADIVRNGREGIDRLVEEASSELTGNQKLNSGILKAQRYDPTLIERTDAIMELFDVLSEEVSYFRTATDKERKVLIDRIQKEPESFGYVQQMFNIFYSGKQIDSWMTMAEPPSKIKKILRRDK
jgi:hypothetical protein